MKIMRSLYLMLIIIQSIFASVAMAFDGGLQSTGKGMGFETASTETTISERIGQYMGVAVSFLGVIFLCLAIYGGYLWMTAQGEEKKVAEAKDIIKRAVIGLIIVVSAYAITAFVGDFASGVTTPSA